MARGSLRRSAAGPGRRSRSAARPRRRVPATIIASGIGRPGIDRARTSVPTRRSRSASTTVTFARCTKSIRLSMMARCSMPYCVRSTCAHPASATTETPIRDTSSSMRAGRPLRLAPPACRRDSGRRRTVSTPITGCLIGIRGRPRCVAHRRPRLVDRSTRHLVAQRSGERSMVSTGHDLDHDPTVLDPLDGLVAGVDRPAPHGSAFAIVICPRSPTRLIMIRMMTARSDRRQRI